MAAYVIAGRVNDARIKKESKALTVFDSIEIAGEDGQVQTMTKAVATPDVARLIRPGARGTFHMFTAIDMRGVYGVKLADGTSASEYPGKSNLRLFPTLLLVSLAVVAFFLFVEQRILYVGILTMVICAAGWAIASRTSRESRSLFEQG